MTTIKKYTTEHQTALFALIEAEGEDWEYHLPENKKRYIETLTKSETYIIFEDDTLAGYARILNDYEVFVMDLLVDKNFRGKFYGQKLMSFICAEFPNQDVYVLGADDVLPYYNKLGYKSAGVIYQVNNEATD